MHPYRSHREPPHRSRRWRRSLALAAFALAVVDCAVAWVLRMLVVAFALLSLGVLGHIALAVLTEWIAGWR